MPYLMSTPMVPGARRLEIMGTVLHIRSVAREPIAYGLISNVRLPSGTSRPVRCGPCRYPELSWHLRKSEPGLGRPLRSACRYVPTELDAPQLRDGPGRKRSDLKGIHISTVQPSSNRPVRTRQTGFQSRLPQHCSSVTCTSVKATQWIDSKLEPVPAVVKGVKHGDEAVIADEL